MFWVKILYNTSQCEYFSCRWWMQPTIYPKPFKSKPKREVHMWEFFRVNAEKKLFLYGYGITPKIKDRR